MTFRDLLRDTIQTLMAHRLRTGLTMFGLAWGVVSITLMTAAGDGLREGQDRCNRSSGRTCCWCFGTDFDAAGGSARAGRCAGRFTTTD